MYLLTNTVKDYAWGSVDALPELLGLPETGQPQAELWIGAHPAAPSTAQSDGEPRSLPDVIASDPQGALGARTIATLGEQLPFLLKILCAAEPLSLQVHPSKEQAEQGYAAENAAGTPADAPDRNYKDSNHKPELLYALTPFDALCGFAPVEQSHELIGRIAGVSGSLDIFDRLVDDLSDPDESAALRRATERLLTLDAPDAAAAVAAVADACARIADDARAATAVELASAHPEDAGVVLSLLLNRVTLAPGEAMYLPAGNIHAYLRGTGIEIMATSDNVLRGGLTPKHVDVPELLAVLEFAPTVSAAIESAAAGDGVVEFRPPVADFRLTLFEPASRGQLRWDEPLPRTLLVLDGEFTISGAAGELRLSRGESAFVAASDAPIDVRGAGRLVAASPNI